MSAHACSVKAHELRRANPTLSQVDEPLAVWVTHPDHYYVGRECEYVKGAAQSKYANPFRAKEHPDLEERLTRFEAHLLAQNEGHSLLDDAVNEFGGRDVWLGCFCSQDKINKGKCHASIVARLVNQRCNQDTISATNEPTHSTPHAERPSQNVYVPRDRRKK